MKKKPIGILKKLIGSVRFWFYKPETKPNWKKTELDWKNKPNRFESVFVIKTELLTSWFESVSVRFKKNFSLVIFFYKNRTENDYP